MTPSNVLLLSENLPPRVGGSARWLWDIYQRLPTDRLVLATSPHPAAAAFDRTAGVRVERLNLTFPSWGLASASGVLRYLNAHRRLDRITHAHGIDAVHCGRVLPEGLLAWSLRWRRGIGYVCFVHGEELNTCAQSRELTRLARAVLGRADMVIANSHNTARLLHRHWSADPQRVQVLHPGVDADRFVPAPHDPAARRAMGWHRRRVVLTVGRLQHRKGHDRMLEAVARLRLSMPDILYAVVGQGEQHDRLASIVEDLRLEEHVQLLGGLTEQQLLACYQQCDLFVLPNREVAGDFEGFGMVLVEAQACGKPVIAGRSGGTAETMCDRRTGLVLDCDNPHTLAEAVASLLANPVHMTQMGKAARRWAQGCFDYRVLAAQARRLLMPSTEPLRMPAPLRRAA